MTNKERQLARQLARDIKEHERRNDYGGTYGQAAGGFNAAVFAGDAGGVREWVLPGGTRTKDWCEAVDAWAEPVS